MTAFMSIRILLLLCVTVLAMEGANWPVVTFAGAHAQTAQLSAGDVVEVYAGLPAPSELPVNGRLAVEFANYRKVLHALDPDFYMVYRAPKGGAYTLKVTAVTDEEPIFNFPRWREAGTIQKIEVFPRRTPWPAGQRVRLRAGITPARLGAPTRGLLVEMEPNDSIAEAQPVAMGASGGDETLHLTGSADDLEYFDNGLVGKKGDDWFRIDYQGREPRLFTANLTLPDPMVVAQLQFFLADGTEYREGANPNERVHQQLEGHRTAMTRTLKPGGVYFLRVEANSPGYDVELRLRPLVPHRDPRQAVQAAMYDHLSQVHAWLLNRPRGAAVERRIRDTGSLLGSHCMSCHTQSGVWGPVGAMRYGYRPENVTNLRQLANLAYESMRPTNVLAEAANNTSLAPLDLGDGPAGTRVAGYNVTTLETLIAPRRLHAAQQIRAANFVLQSADPSGINAAGPGSNVGQAIVYRFSGEILKAAWLRTRNPKYLDALEEKARKMLGITVKYSDDLSNRILFVRDTLPPDFAALRGDGDEVKKLVAELKRQSDVDEQRLRQTQREDGAWGFDPGVSSDGGVSWKVTTKDPKDIDPAPTALALSALASRGFDDRDPAVKRGVAALLAMQDAFGRWNRNALTGFVTTAYSIHALSRLYPVTAEPVDRKRLEPVAGESVLDAAARLRAVAHLALSPEDTQYLDLVLAGAVHAAPSVRYWAQLALGALHDERGVPAQIRGLSDPVKMVREAARWGLRQTLLDDKGWDYLFEAALKGDDLTREAIAGALVMRADGVMTHTAAGFPRLARTLANMMNNDPHPGVRAWATRAAWNWWVWNPPVRQTLNQAFIRSLELDEPNALVESAKRYQTEALFIANGQRANGSREHQYPELAQLFEQICQRLDAGANQNMVRRLVHIAATYYNTAGGDGGPGQMGYVTEKSAEMIGKAIEISWKQAELSKDQTMLRLMVEAAANVTHKPVQDKLLDYSTSGPENLRTLASTSLADPRVVTLPGTQEFLEPLVEQIQRGAQEPERRQELVSPLLRLFSRARWNLPKTDEQQRIFYSLLLPRFPPERANLEENRRIPLQMEKDSPDWYLARALASVVHTNSDLHTETLVERIPTSFETPMEEMFWLPAVRWILHFGKPVPQVDSSATDLPDQYEPQRERIVDLYLKQLTAEKVDPRLRSTAAGIATDASIRRHPKIAAALKRARPEYMEDDPADVKAMPLAWQRNYAYFRDWVVPELLRPNRDDELSCLGCHGVAGRVPSMELTPANGAGYMSARATYANYRILLERINERDVENSKLLRKPLNVQSGKEDGHQGGRRYNPNERGYEILRRWVLDAASLKQTGTP